MGKYYKEYANLDDEIDDDVEIEFDKFQKMEQVVFGNLLGDFLQDGKYSVDRDICAELIHIEKVVVGEFGNEIQLKSPIKFETFPCFILRVKDTRIGLYLLEEINHAGNESIGSGSYCDINEFLVDEMKFSTDNVILNLNEAYKKYNITKKLDEGKIKEISEIDKYKDYNAILKKLALNKLKQNILIENHDLLENVEQEYIDQTLKLIEKYPEFKYIVTKELEGALIDKTELISKNKPFYNRAFRELLDDVIFMNDGELSEKDREEFYAKQKDAKQDYSLSSSKIKDLIEQVQKPDDTKTRENLENIENKNENEISKLNETKLKSKQKSKAKETQAEIEAVVNTYQKQLEENNQEQKKEQAEKKVQAEKKKLSREKTKINKSREPLDLGAENKKEDITKTPKTKQTQGTKQTSKTSEIPENKQTQLGRKRANIEQTLGGKSGATQIGSNKPIREQTQLDRKTETTQTAGILKTTGPQLSGKIASDQIDRKQNAEQTLGGKSGATKTAEIPKQTDNPPSGKVERSADSQPVLKGETYAFSKCISGTFRTETKSKEEDALLVQH